MSYKRPVIILIALLAVFRVLYIVFTPFGLSPDEAHYWEWSRRLDLSYYSKGPGVAYVIAFFTSIFGDNELGVRFGSVFFSTLASYLIYALGRDLFRSGKAGFYAAVLVSATPLFAIGSILMTTDVLLLFFWAAATLCAHRAITGAARFHRRGGAWWYATGALVGLGFLCKYTMVLFYPCLALFLVLSVRERFWFTRTEPYVAGLVSLVLASPVLLWNYLTDWVTIRHTAGQTHLGEAEFSMGEMLEFVGSQAGLLTPFFFAVLVYGVVKAATVGFRRDEPGARLAFFTSAPIFILFLVKSFHGKVQGNWAVVSYVTAFPAAAWAYSCAVRHTVSPAFRRVLVAAATGAIILGGILSAVAYFPWTIERVVPNIFDDPPYDRVSGWEDLGRKASAVKVEMDKKGETFIISDTYQIASLLAFYMDGRPVTYNLDTGERRMNQYDLWPGAEALVGQNALYVKGGRAKMEPSVEEAFEGCVREVVGIYMGERYLKDFTFFRCRGFRGYDGPDTDEVRY